MLIHRLLRGRYRLLFVLAGVLALIGLVSGWRSAEPIYRSTGHIRVAPTLPRILYDSDQNDYARFFDSHVNALATLLESRPVIEQAAASPQLAATGWPRDSSGVARLAAGLTVQHGRGEQVISISVNSPRPDQAKAAVDSVLNAFKDAHGVRQEEILQAKTPVLREREAELQTQIDDLLEAIHTKSDFRSQHELSSDLTKVVQTVLRLEHELEVGSATSTTPPVHTAESTTPRTASPSDPTADLREQEAVLLAERASYRRAYGPHHPMLRELTRQIEVLRIRMALRAIPPSPVVDPAVAPAPSLPEQIVSLRAEAARLRKTQAEVGLLYERLEETKERQAETRQRLDELGLEAHRNFEERITIAAYGDRPFGPYTDKRLPLAAIGVTGGVSIAFAIVALLGLLDPRCRYADQLETVGGTSPLLAVLPVLRTEHDGNAERMTRAVHRLRNDLQLRLDQSHPTGAVVVMTGAEEGAGTTSLVLALATSFTSSGWRVLVIDADAHHARLTRQLHLSDQPGLYDSNAHDQTESLVAEMAAGFHVMPAGAHGRGPDTLAKDNLERLLTSLRPSFDLILVDTGPVLSSLETPLITALSDGVLLLAARDQMMSSVLGSLQQIDRSEAPCLGLVFNRALRADFGFENPIVRFARRQTGHGERDGSDIAVVQQFLTTSHPPTRFIPRRRDAA